MNETATRLLDALDQVIADHGASGVTLRRVGEAAGLSHTAGTHHFTDKTGLFTAYITRAWNDVADGLGAVTTLESPREQLVAAAESYARFALEHPSAFSVMSRLELVRVDTPELWNARERGFFGLAAVIKTLQSTGWASHRDPLDLLATLWSAVHGFTDLWTGGPLSAPYGGRELVPTIGRIIGDLIDALDSGDRE